MGLLINSACLLFVIALWWENHKRFAGTPCFVVDFTFQAFGFFLIVLRGIAPDWASVVFSNILVFAGSIFGYMGLLHFVEKKSTQIPNIVLLVIFTGIHFYFTFVQFNLELRNLNVSLGLLIISFQCMWLMLYGVEPKMRELTRNVGIVFGIYCLISIVRAIHALMTTSISSDFLHSCTFDVLTVAAYLLLFIILTFSLMLMFNKRLLIDIRTQEDKFSVAFHCSPYAIIITRASDGRIIEANNGFVLISGYAITEVIGKSTIDLCLWYHQDDRIQVLNDMVQKKKVYCRELNFKKKSGEVITGLFSSDWIIIDNENCVLSTIADISERKKAEEALQESRFIAEQAARSKAEFADYVAHELRTPLTSLVTTVDTLEEIGDNDDQRQLIAIIKECGAALTSVINQTLDFSRAQAGRITLECIPFDLAQMVKTRVAMHREAASRKGVVLNLVIDQTTSGVVVGDPYRLGQVLGNIIGNAVKFTDEGEILVKAACECGDNGSVFARFKVADTGQGISPEAIPLLFERFSQECTGTTRTHGGSGLGLAICKLLVEQMEGGIRVESVQGKGCIFSFDVVLATADSSQLTYR